MDSRITQLTQSFHADDHSMLARLLDEHPELCQHLHLGRRIMPALADSRSLAMVNVWIDHGASVEDVTEWWAPGFRVDRVEPMIARHLGDLGAEITLHAATGIGLDDVVRNMLQHDPAAKLGR